MIIPKNQLALKTLLVSPIAVFFVYFFTLWYDIPWFDEYESITFSLQQLLDADTLGGKLDALFRPNNEHRIVYAKLVVLVQYWLTGGLSFKGIMLWGNLGLVLIFWFFYRTTQTIQALSLHQSISTDHSRFTFQAFSPSTAHRNALALLLPVPLILFTAQNYLLTFTAIYTLQYLGIIVLVMSTYYVLALNKPGAFVASLGLGALATFSMGNGILLWPCGLAILVIQRRWQWLSIWVVFGAICTWLYFRSYPVQQGNAEGFSYVLEHPLQTLAGFFIFAGGMFDFFPAWPLKRRAVLPFVMGIIIIGIVSYWLVRVLFRKRESHSSTPSHFETFLTGVALFVLANMVIIAVFRIRFYFGMVLHSSYRTYTLVLVAVAYLALMSLLSPIQQKRWIPRLWGVFLFVSVLSYFTYVPEAVQRRKHMQGLTFNQIHNQIGLGGTHGSRLAGWINELDSTMRVRNWHTLPNPAITPDEVKIRQPHTIPIQPIPLRINDQPDYVTIESDEPGYKVGLNQGTYVVFWPRNNDRQAYLMFAERRKPPGINPIARPNGWLASMPKAILPPGRYSIGLFVTKPEAARVIRLDKQVDIR